MTSSNSNVTVNKDTATITLVNDRSLNLNLSKLEGFDNSLVQGAEFTITTSGVKEFKNGGNKYTNSAVIKTDANGSLKLENITPEVSANKVEITLTETNAPDGLKAIDPITVTWVKQSDGKYKIQNSEYSYDETTNTVSITAVDKNVLSELKIVKTDSITGEVLKDAEFEIEIEGAEFEKTTKTTDSNGEIVLNDIVLTSKNAKLKLTETKAPEGASDGSYYYEKVDRTVYFDITYKNFGQADSGIEVTGPYLDDSSTTITQGAVTKEVTTIASNTNTGYKLNVSFKNVPLMDLEGQVWLDGQQGIKNVQEPNGKKEDNEKRLEGVIVYLNAIGLDLPDSMKNGVKTDSEGKYSFIGIESPRTRKDAGYIITFEYNGIDYNDTIKGGDSKAFEENNKDEYTRESLNQRFTTITNGKSNDDTPMQYTTTAAENIAESDLDGDIDGTNPASADKNYKVRAKTQMYTGTNRAVDFGMLERFFDLRLDMVINSARLTINDKETTYSYEQIVLDEENQRNNTDKEETIDLKLYDSDYRYRIYDYKNYSDSMAEEDLDDKTEIINASNDINKQLRAFVTYEVAIMNQSYIHSNVNELAYYYDDGYEFVSAIDENGNNINFKNDSTLPEIDGKVAAKVVLGDSAKDLGEGDYRQVLYFTFEIKRDEDGALPQELEDGKKYSNIVEILSYSTTDGGYVDEDSCPGNSLNQELWEDDTYGAKALRVVVDKDRVRTIEGIVWDDTTNDNSENGKYDDGETKINDVTVQLIEIKNIPDAAGNTKYREAIWQEVASGRNTVKIRNNVTGVTDSKYNNGVTEIGKYKFTGFIPGDYIVRFVYGDGLYTIYRFNGGNLETINTTEETKNNIRKYNGQDYQSTKDLTLDSNNKLVEYKDKENSEALSVARDNEARRLDVMAYSVTIDKDIGDTLNKQTDEMLENTWMCAETSKITINIDGQSNSGEPIIVTALTPSLEFVGSDITFNNVNLGLLRRPQTKLVLEKHITGLKITPTGVGITPIVDARVKDIDNMINSGTIVTEGINSKLKTMISKTNDRGFWDLETDVEELTQSAPLFVEYTYVVKNESENDYLSNTLVTKYQELTQNNGDYAQYLKDLAKDLRRDKSSGFVDKQIGTYLGNYYYKRTVGANDSIVLSRVETIYDYLNNKLNFVEDTSKEEYSGVDFTKYNTDVVNKKYYNTDGAEVTGGIDINSVIKNKTATNFLSTGNNDHTKKVLLSRTLDVKELQESQGISIPSYLIEIVKFTNAAGRRDMEATPENLDYAHSEASNMTLDSYRYTADSDGKITYTTNYSSLSENEKKTAVKINEKDEFWGETIMITKPTGEDKQLPVQIVLITISSLAVIAVGIVLIKKYALTK